MFELTLICYLEAVIILIGIFGAAYFLSRMKEQRQAAKRMAKQSAKLRKDVDASRKTQKNLRLKQDWYKALFNNTADMVFLHGLADDGAPGTFIEVNDMACERLGYPRQALLSMTPLDIEDKASPITAAYSQVDSTNPSKSHTKKKQRKLATHGVRHIMSQVMERKQFLFEQVYKTRMGGKISVEVEARRFDHLGTPVIVHTARDIKMRKEGEEALLESERRLQDFFDHSPFGLAMYSVDRNLLKVNRSCLKMFGIPDQESFSHFNVFDNPYVPKDIKGRLDKGETGRYEAVVNFDDAARHGLFVTTRRGRGYYDILINSMGHDRDYTHRGFFAQIQDITRHRKVEEDLRMLQVMPGGKDAATGISGSLEDMGFTDMIQILCAGGRSMEITFTYFKMSARVFIRDGDIVHCSLDELKGDHAFYALMRWREGEFTAKQCSEFPSQTIETSLMSLLMEGARQSDEA